MKVNYNILILTLLMLVSSVYAIPNSTDALVKEIVLYQDNDVYRHTYYYDSNDNITLKVIYLMEGDVAVPVSRVEWVYQNGQCINQLEHIYFNSDWVLTNRILSEYSNGLKTKEIYIHVENQQESVYNTITYAYVNAKIQVEKTFLGEENNSVVYKNSLWFYNDDNQLIKQSVSYQTSDEFIVYNYDYIYKDNSTLLDSLIVSSESLGQTQKLSLTTFFYHPENQNLVMQIQKIWNETTLLWTNQTKLEYEYDQEQRLIKEYLYAYATLFWKPQLKYEYVFDSQGLLAEKIMYQPIYEKWRKNYTITYSAIEKNKPSIMQSQYEFWGGEIGNPLNNYIPFYFNDEMKILKADKLELLYILQTDDITTQYEGEIGRVNIYPNPSRGIFYISTDKYKIENWMVHNMNGQIVKSKHNNYHTGVVDLSQLNDGIYLFKAQTLEGKELTQKVIIQKTK